MRTLGTKESVKQGRLSVNEAMASLGNKESKTYQWLVRREAKEKAAKAKK